MLVVVVCHVLPRGLLLTFRWRWSFLSVGGRQFAEVGFAVLPERCARIGAFWGIAGSGGFELASGDLEDRVAVQIGDFGGSVEVGGAGAAVSDDVLPHLAFDREARPLGEVLRAFPGLVFLFTHLDHPAGLRF